MTTCTIAYVQTTRTVEIRDTWFKGPPKFEPSKFVIVIRSPSKVESFVTATRVMPGGWDASVLFNEVGVWTIRANAYQGAEVRGALLLTAEVPKSAFTDPILE